MAAHPKTDTELEALIGLGSHSSRKSYHAELEKKIEELELERNRYKGLFDNALHGIFQATSGGQIIATNPALADICGFESSAHLLTSLSNRIENLFFSDIQFRQFWQLLTEQQQLKNHLSQLKDSENPGTPIEVSITAISTGTHNGMIEAFVQDITQQKKAEHDLLIAATAFESQEGMIITDTHQTILKVNKAFTRITGYQSGEAIGKTPSILKSDRHSEAFYRKMMKRLTVRGYWHGEIWNKRKNGEVYPEYLTISAVTSPDGTVSNYVGAFTDITQLKEKEADIQRLAYFDTLTGLPNRQNLMEYLDRCLTDSSETGQRGAVLLIDLDNFKNVNDIQGHSVGDELLVGIADRLKNCIRRSDLIARLGGDEFIIVLKRLGRDSHRAERIINDILSKLDQQVKSSFLLDTIEYRASCSIGITPFNGSETTDEVMKRADMALYQAKSAGKDTYRFYDPNKIIPQHNWAELELELRNALPNNQFELYFQPQYQHDNLIGAEVLLRWKHPHRGVVSPVQFIPIAEETGLIIPIGWWVLEQSCLQLKRWQEEPVSENFKLAVNVSARQFSQVNFVDVLLKIIENTAITPSKLKLELTESLVVADINDTINKMKQLRQIGVEFSLDDFGTGYSSLSHLKKLPLQQLKIDASFIRDITHDKDDDKIVQSIITMANDLGLNVIAEGVELVEQKEILLRHNCECFQGYLYGKPQPISDFHKNHIDN